MMRIVILLAILFSGFVSAAQVADEQALLQILRSKNPKETGSNEVRFLKIYSNTDSAGKTAMLQLLERESSSSNLFAAARSLLWKGVLLRRVPFSRKDAADYMLQANNRAVESGDACLQVQCFEIYADDCMSQGKPETALFYYLKAAELRKNLDDTCFRYKTTAMYGVIGQLLHKMQEYSLSTRYLQQSLAVPPSDPVDRISAYNTIGLNYQRLQQYDSAIGSYSLALQYAETGGIGVWAGIVSGNIGALYFEQGQYEKALPLLRRDFASSLASEPQSAGNTLHRIALIYLHRRQTDSALLTGRRALQLVQQAKVSSALFLRNTYGALARIFRKTGQADSAFFYSDIYHRINDSLNQAAAANRADVAQTRLDFEKSSNSIKALLKEKQAEKNWRNLLAAALLLLAAAGWLYFRWQRQRYYTRQQALLHQQQLAEAEAGNAREQLAAFMQKSIEKNELIEKLQVQLQQQHLQLNEELLTQSILTENDWLRFKDMFEKANPGYLSRLRAIAPDITTAELRLAALTRLNLGNKHIASMLGIGTDAVRKTKSRLRLRLNIGSETELEDFIKSIIP